MSAAATITVPHINYSAIAPEMAMIVGGLLLLIFAALSGKRLSARFSCGFTILVGLVSLYESIRIWFNVTGLGHSGYVAVDSAISVDGFSALIMMLVSITVILVSLGAAGFLIRESMNSTEFQVLMMLSASGAMLMAGANDLIVLFLGLEILSIALYVLAGSNLRRKQSGEAAIKYFVLGGFSSAIFLYGIALVYGATGSTNLAQIGTFLSTNLIVHNGVLLAGLAMLLVGFGFKVAAVPFHTWAPDVYQGAPTPAVSFMAAAVKAGSFAGLIRVLDSALPTLRLDWEPIIWALAVLSLVAGSILAVVQRDVKRMLAYSSISHAGFVLIGIQVATAKGIAGSLYYLFTYTFVVIGAFTVASVVGGKGDAKHDLADYRGLARKAPMLALGMTVFLLAQAGVPFTTGFLAKFSVVAAAADAHSYAIAVIAMVSAVIAAFFYLRVVIFMFTPEGTANRSLMARFSAQASTPAEKMDLPEGQVADPILLLAPAGSHSSSVAGGLERDDDLLASSSSHATSGPYDIVGDISGAVVTEDEVDESALDERSESMTLPSMPSMPSMPIGPTAVIGVCAAVTVVFGIWAGPLLDFARNAILYF